jgi:S-adenosylmethionine:tRNA ribosyltransferase-isomerase
MGELKGRVPNLTTQKLKCQKYMYMNISDFDYELPEELIALEPLPRRDDSRLLVYDGRGSLHDSKVLSLEKWLNPGDLVIFNNTRVIPAHIVAYKDSRAIELLLLEMLPELAQGTCRWSVLAKPAKKLRIGDRLCWPGGFKTELLHKKPDGTLECLFNASGELFWQQLEEIGQMPLPPYIRRRRTTPYADDNERYQTIFADIRGAVAAPTAGLHFTPQLMAALANRGIRSASITLHVGAGTFLPVKSEWIHDHVMHEEYYDISVDTVNLIQQTKASGGRVVAIGTTSLRALEGAYQQHGSLVAASGKTNIFITPGYQFNVVDMLFTNFHLPRSTLLMLVSAFIGMNQARTLYDHAINERYRFYSYGDASLLMRSDYLAL